MDSIPKKIDPQLRAKCARYAWISNPTDRDDQTTYQPAAQLPLAYTRRLTWRIRTDRVSTVLS